jgi:hypothetical protein
MRSAGLNQEIAFPHFRHAQVENHAGTAFCLRWRDPLRAGVTIHTPPSAWGVEIGGLHFTDAMGKAGGELSEERLANGEEGARAGWREDLRSHFADDVSEPGV